MDFVWTDVINLFAAVIAGAAIGLERELNDKPAGFRTNILICLGAAMFTLLSSKIAGDGDLVNRTRISAQVVTGVGFLGAGAIIQFRGNVIGLTTAATIWAVASVGMAFGAGAYDVGIIGTLLVVGVLFGLAFSEKAISRWRETVVFDIAMEASKDSSKAVEMIVRSYGLHCDSWIISADDQEYRGKLEVTGPSSKMKDLQASLVGDPAVRSVRRTD